MNDVEPAKVLVFPPLIPVSGFLVGIVLERLLPLGRWLARSPFTSALGGLLLAAGAAGFAWMVITMKRAGTPISNFSTPAALVETGPFRWTRNPMYLFGSIGYAGLALLLREPWSLALLPAVVAATHHGVVLREEALLDRLFGEPYRRYRARVRRWL